ncbi:hypothetical protein KFK09_017754 [Dendrobium nobile]|uniref:Uncharacterized protein n=1 Tax=Dendrobium nobile TaxID=94219 RepID=A0A8T3ATY3_DENNO|nr:hypothetical protein KFK09_017754 [Dendrobium nobile]
MYVTAWRARRQRLKEARRDGTKVAGIESYDPAYLQKRRGEMDSVRLIMGRRREVSVEEEVEEARSRKDVWNSWGSIAACRVSSHGEVKLREKKRSPKSFIRCCI